MSRGERLHYFGRYVIRMERLGCALVYDILTRGGLLVAAGFDMLSMNEETALEGITNRLSGKDRERNAA